jgi:hypothetical protein
MVLALLGSGVETGYVGYYSYANVWWVPSCEFIGTQLQARYSVHDDLGTPDSSEKAIGSNSTIWVVPQIASCKVP